MARYRRRRYGRRSSGNKKLFGLGTKGLLSLGVIGALGAAFMGEQLASMVPVDIPFKKQVVQYAIGGPAGVVLGVAKDALMGNGGTGTATW